LIAAREAITADHCLAGYTAGHIDVVLGLEDLCRPHGDEPRVRVTHVRRDASTDVAVLELGESPPVTPVPVASQLRGGGHLYAWGWGRRSPSGPLPCHPTAKPLSLTSATACEQAGVHLGGRQFCALPTTEVNTCAGDSGGPVVDEQGEVVAITSGGRGCGPMDPGSYSPVAAASSY
jgi:S1-C subfamily serine protease